MFAMMCCLKVVLLTTARDILESTNSKRHRSIVVFSLAKKTQTDHLPETFAREPVLDFQNGEQKRAKDNSDSVDTRVTRSLATV